MSNDDRRRTGPGRRTYNRGEHSPGAGRHPRVGRVATDVPPARRVGAGSVDAPARADRGRTPGGDGLPRRFAPRNDGGGGDLRQEADLRQGADLRRGAAYRAPSGPRRPEAFEAGADDGRLLAGRNPIREALRAGRPVEKLLVAEGELSGAGREIVRMAKAAGAVVQRAERARLDQIYPAHQGMLAYVAATAYATLEAVLDAARAKGEAAFVVVLDGITDPHNLGAIIRSAECAGAHGVIVPERRAAGLTPAAAKAAAGALDHLPVARVGNLNRALDALKAEGLWVVGTAMDGEDAFSADLTGPVALVIGSEGDGVSRLTLERCDRTVSLPVRGRIQSLNASVAAGVLMYEIVRQRST